MCILLTLPSIGLVYFLYLFSPENDSTGSGFTRHFTASPDVLVKSAIPKSIQYIAGSNHDLLYLGGNSPQHLSVYTDGIVSPVLKPPSLPASIQASKSRVLSDYIFIEDLGTSKFYRGALTDLKLTFCGQSTEVIAETVVISYNTLVQRVLAGEEFVLVRNEINNNQVTLYPGLLEKQVDGMFCVDGSLHYNTDLHQLVYVYHYRNAFISMDTSLNVLYRGNTIDTISRVNFTVDRIRSENAYTFSSPPKFVNLKSTTAGQLLYIQSGIRAENETKKNFKENFCIDVYSLLDGVYQHSFYIPKIEKQSLLDFNVIDDFIFVLYDGVLVTYQMDT